MNISLFSILHSFSELCDDLLCYNGDFYRVIVR
jgi:hypothetical protein